MKPAPQRTADGDCVITPGSLLDNVLWCVYLVAFLGFLWLSYMCAWATGYGFGQGQGLEQMVLPPQPFVVVNTFLGPPMMVVDCLPR